MSLAQYVRRLTHLRTDAGKGKFPAACLERAPHKPLLLLSIMDLIAEGTLTANLVELTPDLAETFALYWSKVMPLDRRGILAYPFFFMRSEGFWHLVPRPGKEEILLATRAVSSANQLKALVLGATLDEELFVLLSDPAARETLRAAVLERYFSPDVRPVLVEQGVVNVEAFRYSEALLESARESRAADGLHVAEYVRPAARDQGFRRAVVLAYAHRCGFCGIRMTTADGHTVVEAAHIVPWSESKNDNPRNGLALCRLCHWTFDEGLLSLSAVYLILASPQLGGNGNLPAHLATLVGRGLLGPDEEALRPDLEAVRWHRETVFRRR